MRYIYLFFLLTFYHTVSIGQKKDLIFQQISPDAGFAFDEVSSIVEDENGFIWFGCSNGLYHYNSLEFIKYNFDPAKENTPPSNIINYLFKDWNNKIWACTDNGLCVFDEKENAFKRINLKKAKVIRSKHDVEKIIQYAEDKYLLIVNRKLYQLSTDGTLKSLDEVEGVSFNPTHVYFIGLDNDENILVGSTKGTLWRLNKTLTSYSTLYEPQRSNRFSAIKTVCQINSKYWIGYQNSGVHVIEQNGELVKKYNSNLTGDNYLPNNLITKIISRPNGDIWLGSLDGIQIISKNGNRTIRQTHHNNLPLNFISELYIDRQGGVWVGTWSGGLAYYSDHYYRFKHIKRLNETSSTPRNVISCFAETQHGTVLIGSETLGIFEYDTLQSIFVNKMLNPQTTPFTKIESLCYDKNNTLWIGTFQEGLWKYKNNTLSKIKCNKDLSIINMSITSVDSGLWIGGTGSGLIYYDIDKNQATTYKQEDSRLSSISSNIIRKTFVDSRGNLWICTNYGLSLKRKNEPNFERFYYNNSENSLSRNIIYTIAEDSYGKIWIGTSGGGIDIYDVENNVFSKLHTNNTLNRADIYTILNDRNGNMWISSDRGIFQYIHESKTFHQFSEVDGLLGNQHTPNSGFLSSTGKLYFGGANGFNIIDPAVVKRNPIIPEIYLSKLLVNFDPINSNNIKSANAKHIANIKTLELKHNQNSLSFSFVANSFIKPSKNIFKYRINNYIDEWIESKQGQYVSLSKIPPGKYVLEIIGANNDGVWSKKPKEIKFTIHPPIWASWYAYLSYAIILITLAYLVFKELSFRVKIRKDLIEERFKHDADETLFAEKTKFFTNVSHEFRTPLNLIISPLNNLIQKFEYDKNVSDHLKIMKRNADRLLRLTNQILDFRLIEIGKLKADLREADIVQLCNNVTQYFEYQITEKEMNYIFTSSFKSFKLNVDAEQVEKIVYNLMSNALKYSAEKGQIILSIEEKELTVVSYNKITFTGNKFFGKTLEIKLKDSGKGIDQKNLSSIFDRFYVDATGEETGTGIGLHICQEYIRLHNGNIMVSSEKGKGTSFAVNLPMAPESKFEKENIIFQSHLEKNKVAEPEEDHFQKSDKIILFAEDNDDLRIYLKNVLQKRYKVLTAKNGQQALEIACEVIPDIIISDIMMPGMDGLELTKQLKSKAATSLVPIILLTALTDDKYQIDSTHIGVDYFLTKPVDESLLFAHIKNILGSRAALKEQYIEKATGQKATDANETFEKKAEKIVEQNLQNTGFGIEHMANELGISRSSLHRKIKSSTNLSPSEFIRDIRLSNAVNLMKTGKYNIDEIGTYVGFNSTSYFIRSFKKKYGQTPKEYYSKLNN